MYYICYLYVVQCDDQALTRQGARHARGVLTAGDVMDIAEGMKLGDDVRVAFCPTVYGYLAHKKHPPPLGPP